MSATLKYLLKVGVTLIILYYPRPQGLSRALPGLNSQRIKSSGLRLLIEIDKLFQIAIFGYIPTDFLLHLT